MALTGNIHSRTTRGTPWSAEFEPMGYVLRQAMARRRILSLDVAHSGGTAWLCTSSEAECGEKKVGPRGPEGRGIVWSDSPVDTGHHGWYRVGPLSASPPATQGTDPEDREAVARAYLKALEAMDWQAQATFYTAESVFEDPTAVFFGEPWHYVGAEAIAGFWRSSTEGAQTLEVRHDIRRLFVTGPYVVIDLTATVRNRGEFIGFPDREIESTIQVSTVLRSEDGKVLHHLDHANYEGTWVELQALKQRFEAEARPGGERAADQP